MSDDALAAQAAAADSAAFGQLVERHQAMLRGFLLRLTRGNSALADDLAQDAFIDAWRSVSQFRGEGSFRGWLTRIAYRRYLAEARRRKLEALDDSAEAEERSDGLEPAMRFDLERCMAKLPVAERAALTLCYALGHSNDEAAKILEVPVGTLKSHVLRGRKRLLAMLESAS